MKEQSSLHFLWLTGWSVSSDIWKPYLDWWTESQHTIIDLHDCIRVEEIREKAKTAFTVGKNLIVVGWSLGSMLALEMAPRFQQKIIGMFLIGSTSQFVRQQENEIGIHPRQFTWMKKQITRSPKNGLALFDNQMFTPSEREAGWDLKWREEMRNTIPELPSLLAGLQYLQQFRIPSACQNIMFPTFLLSGGKDPICPVSGAYALAQTLPLAKLDVWEEAGHVPFWTSPLKYESWLKAGIKIAIDKKTNRETI